MELDWLMAYIGAHNVTRDTDCGAFCDAITDTLQQLMNDAYHRDCVESGGIADIENEWKEAETEWQRS